VALRFDAARMIAPQVVAKGAGYVAERIKQIAAENDVPLVEDKPLARTLYKIVEIGNTIPADLYKAVAEVLAYVYRLRGTRPTM
jgi:flagellar biosynthetic protein FlhB